MSKFLCVVALAWLGLTFTPAPARAQAAWDPHSTAAAPCGIGTPPLGEEPIAFAPAGIDKALTLTVRQDGSRLCYVYDGIARAPLIRVKPGDRLTVTLRNEITDPAAIEAYLPPAPAIPTRAAIADRSGFYAVEPGTHHVATGTTNLHLHGFPLSPLVPQDETVMTCADPATGPAHCGHREIVYRYEIPTSMPPGLYWYHPHIHGEVQAQVQMGLLGAIVVDGPADAQRSAVGIAERVLVFGQTRDPRQVRPGVAAAASETPAPVHKRHDPATAAARIDTDDEVECGGTDTDGLLTLNGTPLDNDNPDAARLAQRDDVGKTRLDDDGDLNFERIRKPEPGQDDHLARFPVPEGGKQLWRVVNGATDDYLNLAIVDEEGAPTPIEIVARDGMALTDDRGQQFPPIAETDRQLLPPAGRLEFLVPAPPPGHKRYLVTDGIANGCAGDIEAPRRLALITAGPAAEPAAAGLAAPSAMSRAPAYYDGLLARKTVHTRTIALTEYPRPGSRDENDFYITELKPGAVMRPYAMGGPPAITVAAGAVEEWVIENWTHEVHAFHIHQIHFRVLAENGQTIANPPLLDVVNVPFANPDTSMPSGFKTVPGSVRIKLVFPREFAGDIPFHCHLMQHEDHGMMGVIHVVDGAAQRSTRVQHAAADELDLDHLPMCKPVHAGGARGLVTAALHRLGIE